MSESCNHDCGNCSQSCGSGDPKSFIEQPHEKSHIKKTDTEVPVLSIYFFTFEYFFIYIYKKSKI